MDWPKLLEDLRERGWTQQVIAERAGCSQGTISDLLNGRISNPGYQIGRVIEALHSEGSQSKSHRAEA